MSYQEQENIKIVCLFVKEMAKRHLAKKLGTTDITLDDKEIELVVKSYMRNHKLAKLNIERKSTKHDAQHLLAITNEIIHRHVQNALQKLVSLGFVDLAFGDDQFTYGVTGLGQVAGDLIEREKDTNRETEDSN